MAGERGWPEPYYKVRQVRNDYHKGEHSSEAQKTNGTMAPREESFARASGGKAQLGQLKVKWENERLLDDSGPRIECCQKADAGLAQVLDAPVPHYV